ncbi:uncharacterized protein GGS22DRAFT_38010 [Annulohypoxylon maeteangense]|uniref:uncharacterized protein n=1 Tax=Annulohypoxylon maeteangense TaxID=1927788 RepID=UPI002007CA85|nr:uncharacterized protein GGS22DRAFT_38010 [Annulohypoxylon maeteangense]KAI0883256.1 hypothetical protein GGS22DRAFT_38010 [Annulohypoxylon maeteangense]
MAFYNKRPLTSDSVKPMDSISVQSINDGYHIIMSDTSDWSFDADGVLCLMKTKDWTWDMISKILQRPVKDAKERFQLLTSLAKDDGGIPTDIIGELYFLKMRRYPTMLDDILSRSSEFEKGKAELDKAFKNRSLKLSDSLNGAGGINGSWLDSIIPNTGATEAADSLPEHRSSAPSSSSSSGYESSGSSEVAEMEPFEPKKEVQVYRPKDAIINSYAREFPEMKKLRADKVFTKWECKALATLEARQRGNKWFNLSADFTNLTGRDVDADVLQAKLEKAPTMNKSETATFYGFERPANEEKKTKRTRRDA